MNRINVSDVIDQNPLRPFQIFVLVLCTLCLIIDGFDVQAMGYAAPAIIKDWGVAKAGFGSVFGAGLLGMTIGALFLGVVADKIGRRPVLIGALLYVAACTFGTMYATSLNDLMALRFVTGLGMGAIIPNAIALAGEFSPGKIRVTLMMITSLGFVIGGAVGGAVAAALIPAFGWQSVFLTGAIAPLAIAIVMLFALPESLQFMVLSGKHAGNLRRWLGRTHPGLRMDDATEFVVREKNTKGVPFVNLFRNRMAIGTILIWVVNFMNLICAYFLANWLPVVMNEAGHSTAQAVLAGTMLWIGGIAGNLLLGWLVDRRGFGPVMTGMFCVGTLSIAAIGQVSASLPIALVAITAAGFCVMGGQSALNALGATYYPTSIRSTGMGWAMGIGRLGSIFGPVVGGELMRLNWSTGHLFFAAAMPTLVAVLASLLFWRLVNLPKPGAAGQIGNSAVSPAHSH